MMQVSVRLFHMIEKILLEMRPNGVAILTFNRPASRNALDTDAMRLFASHVDQLQQVDNLRAVILTGAGDVAFCAGADLAEMSQRPTAEDGAAMIALMGDALHTLEALPVPIIGAINGYALGGGAEVSLACDLRVVDANVRLGFVQAKRGVIPGWGGGQRLLRLVGYARALELFLTARALKADELLSLGIVTSIAPAGEALNAALTLADQVAELDIAVIHATKQMLRNSLTRSYDEALIAEREMFPPLWAGEARLRATQAFLEKK